MTTLTRSDFRFFDRLRVRWAEIDAQKIVFNGHYLMLWQTYRCFGFKLVHPSICKAFRRRDTNVLSFFV